MDRDDSIDILACTSDEFAAAALHHGVKKPRAREIYHACLRDGRFDEPWVRRPDMSLGRTQREETTTKFVLQLGDGLETESVILPQRGRTGRLRHSLCVSSQVGCAMGCTFCETGRMGLLRNLSASGIVAQWFAARHELGCEITNIVFMGMGEPMDNLDAVLQAVRVLADRNGAGIPASRISISTVGHLPGIERLATFTAEPGFRQLRLAVSLNAPNDVIRDEIMPLNRAMPMNRLRDALLAWPAAERLPILVEYVLIPGVNDAPRHARELCEYLEPVNCSINVIPYNPRRDSPWPAPAEADVDAFIERVRAAGGTVRRRQTMGRSVMAACGQLGNGEHRRR
ncbi:MAG: 23S rRNA (adenine(2503)-C(2))-methyltransferase RlmN [Planctomycetes bacterium]|nr:23S rRNA (adenine(2503)-C(2))-methyltransferase RlmN [Planctomycetota bacterium]